jgi:hypothetical protein
LEDHALGASALTTSRAVGLLWGATAAGALTIALTPGAAGATRHALQFELAAHRGTPTELVGIFATNLRLVVLLALTAVARRRHRCIAIALAGVAIANALLVGAAAGAYGPAALPYLVHLPLEWAAFASALALTTHRDGRRLSLATLLLLVAALCETYLTPQ